MLSVNNPVLAPLATLQANLFDDSASRYAIGARYYFNECASWYVVGSVLTQGPGAHYCLGASGHGYQFLNDTAMESPLQRSRPSWSGRFATRPRLPDAKEAAAGRGSLPEKSVNLSDGLGAASAHQRCASCISKVFVEALRPYSAACGTVFLLPRADRDSHRSHDEQREPDHQEIHDRGDGEHRMPAASIRLQDVGQGDDKGGQAFRRIEQAGVGRGVFRTEHVSAS